MNPTPKQLTETFLHISSQKFSQKKKLDIKQFQELLEKSNPHDYYNFLLLLSEHIAGKNDIIDLATKDH
jgi:hypothetical protein